MHPHRYPAVALFAIGLALAAEPAHGYSGGPPDGFAGDPPLLRNCTACHSSYALNSGNGALTLTGLPLEYAPGETYLLDVHLVDPGQKRWGFELTAIAPASGNEAGTLIPLNDTTTQISYGTGEERDYVKQRAAGTFPNTNFGDWGVYWVAPQAGAGEARFYVAGNAANNGSTPAGDFIYTLSIQVAEAIPVAVSAPVEVPRIRLSSAPNPLRDGATLDFEIARSGRVGLRVFDAQGRSVRFLLGGELPSGRYQTDWDGRDQGGREVPNGVYFYLLNVEGERTTLRAVKIR